MKQEAEAHDSQPRSPILDPSSGMSSQPGLAYHSHMSPDLIGAVHMQDPMTHLPTHAGHMTRRRGPAPPMSQTPEGMGPVMMDGGVKGCYPGGAVIGFSPFADAEALNKLRGHPAWEHQVSKIVLLS